MWVAKRPRSGRRPLGRALALAAMLVLGCVFAPGTASAAEEEGQPLQFVLLCGSSPVPAGRTSLCVVKLADTEAGSQVPTGVVAFNGGGVSIESSCALIKVGTTFSDCFVQFQAGEAGEFTIEAEYRGDATHPRARKSTTVKVTDTSTTLICTPSTLVAGQATTCGARVRNVGPIPNSKIAGTVRFQATSPGGFDSPSCTLLPLGDGTSFCAVKYTPADGGSRTIRAVYEGNQTHSGSAGIQDLEVKSPIVTVTCSPQTLEAGKPSNCGVAVFANGVGSTKVTGSVTFESDRLGKFSMTKCVLFPVGENHGVCSVTYTPEEGGPAVVRASYSGDATHPPTKGEEPLIVTTSGAATTSSITCSPKEPPVVNPQLCTAHVRDTSASPVAPVGTVAFASERHIPFNPGACKLAPVSGAESTCTVEYATQFTVSDELTVSYLGDSKHRGSEGSARPVHRTSMLVTCAPTKLFAGESTECQAIVHDAEPNPIAILNFVDFSAVGPGGKFSRTSCEPTAIEPGTAACSTLYTPLVPGSHEVFANYLGDPFHEGSFEFTQVSAQSSNEGGSETE